MNDTIVQAGLWIGAGFLLIMLLGRRRKRRVER
jgi:LPXTG-motif cell wall-anchored protein